MTADTYSLELVLTVTVKDNSRGRDEKTTSHAGADAPEDVQVMALDTTNGVYFPDKHEVQTASD